jgi:hypothetical protein
MFSAYANFFLYGGTIGLLVGFVLLFYFLFRRINWIINIFSKEKKPAPGILSSLRNLVLIMLWTSVFGMLLFAGFFLRAYQVYTMEEPVAEIYTEPLDTESTCRVTLKQFVDGDSQITKSFLIKGDQWMLEGDILKWDNLINFLGLQTRYRLTRIRGRYILTEDELNQQQTVYSLVENETHPTWRLLYKYGTNLPFVSTVYGDAVFQVSDSNTAYLVFVTPSGFIVREK